MNQISALIDRTKPNLFEDSLCSQSESALRCFLQYINNCFQKGKSLPGYTPRIKDAIAISIIYIIYFNLFC